MKLYQVLAGIGFMAVGYLPLFSLSIFLKLLLIRHTFPRQFPYLRLAIFSFTTRSKNSL